MSIYITGKYDMKNKTIRKKGKLRRTEKAITRTTSRRRRRLAAGGKYN